MFCWCCCCCCWGWGCRKDGAEVEPMPWGLKEVCGLNVEKAIAALEVGADEKCKWCLENLIQGLPKCETPSLSALKWRQRSPNLSPLPTNPPHTKYPTKIWKFSFVKVFRRDACNVVVSCGRHMQRLCLLIGCGVCKHCWTRSRFKSYVHESCTLSTGEVLGNDLQFLLFPGHGEKKKLPTSQKSVALLQDQP